jgi:hypothetical protein
MGHPEFSDIRSNQMHRWIPLPLRYAQGQRHHDFVAQGASSRNTPPYAKEAYDGPPGLQPTHGKRGRGWGTRNLRRR